MREDELRIQKRDYECLIEADIDLENRSILEDEVKELREQFDK